MENKEEFIEFIQNICERPRMFSSGSFDETAAFIQGYAFGSATPISDRVFDRFVCVKNSFPSNYVWSIVIKLCTKSDVEAIQLTKKTILEFVELREKMSDDELIQFAIDSVELESVEVCESIQVFKVFDKALLYGDKKILEPIVKANKNAEILWQGKYPKDVAISLEDLSKNQPVKKIFESEDGKQIKLIAHGWPFSIEMNFIDGNWKVNADDIIEMWMANIS